MHRTKIFINTILFRKTKWRKLNKFKKYMIFCNKNQYQCESKVLYANNAKWNAEHLFVSLLLCVLSNQLILHARPAEFTEFL